MTTVNKVQQTQTKKAETKKAEETQQQTQPKSADVNSTQPSAKAQEIKDSGQIKDGVYKNEHGTSTVGDIAQANAMKEDGTVDPAEVQGQVLQMVNDNPALKAAAQEAGINLNDPSPDDLQKLANLEVKAGQEVKCPDKAEEAKTPEEAKEAEEAKEEGACDKPKAEEAKAPEEKKDKGQDVLGQIMDLVAKAESSQDPAEKSQLADQALQMINQVRQEKGIKPEDSKQQNGQQQNETAGKIQSGQKMDDSLKADVAKAMDGPKDQLAQILDSLQQRATAAKTGGGQNAQNQQNPFGQQNGGMNDLVNGINQKFQLAS